METSEGGGGGLKAIFCPIEVNDWLEIFFKEILTEMVGDFYIL